MIFAKIDYALNQDVSAAEKAKMVEELMEEFEASSASEFYVSTSERLGWAVNEKTLASMREKNQEELKLLDEKLKGQFSCD